VPGQKRVFLVASYLDTTFNKTPFALRDKSILKIERDKVDALELVSGTTTGAAREEGIGLDARQARSWRAQSTPRSKRPFERLSSAQMVGLTTADAGKDLAKYGLDKPTATMAVTSGSSRAELLLGKTENAVVFAKDASRPMVFTVAPTDQGRRHQEALRLPAKGPVRRALVHGDARGVQAGRRHDRARQEQDEGREDQGREGRLEEPPPARMSTR
jgi:hypothetical protein